MLLLQLTPFLADSTDSHVVVGLVTGLNPSKQAQAHLTHSRVQGATQSTRKEIVQQRDDSVTNVRNSHILRVVAKQRLLVKLKLIPNHRRREHTLLTR